MNEQDYLDEDLSSDDSLEQPNSTYNTSRISGAGLNRGVGGATRATTNTYSERQPQQLSTKTARSIIRRSKKTEVKREEKEKVNKKKMTGLLFYIVLAIVGIDDLSDLILGETGIASVISVVSSTILAIYLFFSRVKLTDKKLVLYISQLVIELIPIINWLPSESIALIWTRIMENNEHLGKIAKGISAKRNPTIIREKRG